MQLSDLSPTTVLSAARGAPNGLPAHTLSAIAAVGVALTGGALVLARMTPAPSATIGVALALYGAAALICLLRIGPFHPHARFGLPNVLTLCRLALGTLAAGVLAAPALASTAWAAPVGWAMLAGAALALVLDGLDGWVARRQALASRFGARFDMEVDALVTAVLAGFAVAHGKLGAWVLLLAAPRYVFLAAQALVPALRRPLPPARRRKAVCVFQVGVLAALAAPPVTGRVAALLAVTALMALVWSFAVDVRWCLRAPKTES